MNKYKFPKIITVLLISFSIFFFLSPKSNSYAEVNPVAPTVPTLEYPIGGEYITDNTPLMQWSDSTINSGTIAGYYYRIFYNCSDINNIPDSCSVYPNLNGLWRTNSEYQAGTTAERTYYWQVRSESDLGVLSEWSGIEQFTIDTTPPVAPTDIRILDHEGNNLGCGGYTNNRKITVDWEHPNESEVAYYRYDIKDKDNQSHPTKSQLTGNIRDIDGQYKYRVWAVDYAGNMSEQSSGWCGVTLDRIPPFLEEVGLIYEGNNHIPKLITNDNTPFIYIFFNDLLSGPKFGDIRVDGNSAFAGAGGPGFSESNFNTLAEGLHTLEIILEDEANNSITIEKDLVIDTKAPTATYTHYKNDKLITDPIAYVKSLSELTFKGAYNDPIPSSGLYQDSFVIFQAQDDGSFRFSSYGKKSYCSWRKEPNLVHLSGTTYETVEKIQFTKCIDELPEGEYYMAHQVYDNATRKDIPSINQFRDVLGLHFIVDKTPPKAPVLTSDPVQYVKWGNVTRSWLPSSSTDVDYYMYKNISNGWTSGPYDAGQTEYVITHPTGNYDRAFEWQVKAVDNAGNETWSEDTYRVVVDNTKPTVEITNVDITDKKLSFTVSGADNLSGARTVGTNIYNEDNTGPAVINIGRLAHNIPPETLSVSYDATDIDVSGLASGIYTIRAAIRDYSENIEFATYQITVDNTPPVTTLNEEIEGVFTNEAIIIEGESIDELSEVDYVDLYYRQSSTTTWLPILELENNENDSEFTWSYSWTPSEEGTYDIKASATDTAGNEEQSPQLLAITYDITPPEIKLIDLSDGFLNLTTEDILSGTNTVEIKIDDGEWITYTSDMNLNELVNNEPDTYIVYIRVTDKAGNIVEDSTEFTIEEGEVAGASDHRVPEEENNVDTSEDVKGASSTLPATGASIYISIIALILLISGSLILFVFNRKNKLT